MPISIKIAFTIHFIWDSKTITITISIPTQKLLAFPTITLHFCQPTNLWIIITRSLSTNPSWQRIPQKNQLLNLRPFSKRIILSKSKRTNPKIHKQTKENCLLNLRLIKMFNNYICLDLIQALLSILPLK